MDRFEVSPVDTNKNQEHHADGIQLNAFKSIAMPQQHNNNNTVNGELENHRKFSFAQLTRYVFFFIVFYSKLSTHLSM